LAAPMGWRPLLAIEDFLVQKPVPDARLEAFDEANPPGASERNLGDFCPNCGDPLPRGVGGELREITVSYMN